MPNELNIALATTGLTVTAQPYQNGAAVGSAISCPETGSTGFYSGNMAGSSGTYQIAFRAAGANVGSGSIVWDGTAEVASSAPSAAQNAAAVWSQATRTVTGGTVDTLTNAPSVPSASAIASQVRTELSVELGRVDASISSRATAANIPTSDITAIKAKTDALPASPAATGDIPSANISAIKAKTDLLNTDRLAQVSTVSTTGAQLAAALS